MSQKWKSLEDRMLYYRGLADYRLLPKSYVVVMIDGRSFSKLIKNKYEKPFDATFINYMNKTAQYVCEQVSGCKMAYVQSDEISFILTDFETPTTDGFFGYRLCKMHSLIAAMASGYFNRLVTIDMLKEGKTVEDIENQKLIEFDCRAWNVPSYNDAVAWLLFRQIDCVRNSKQQTAQTYLSHKQLMNKDTDEQIKLLLDTVGVDWNKFNRGEKYGRFIYRKEETYYNAERNATYIRRPFCVFEAPNLMDEDERQKFLNSNIIPKRD